MPQQIETLALDALRRHAPLRKALQQVETLALEMPALRRRVDELCRGQEEMRPLFERALRFSACVEELEQEGLTPSLVRWARKQREAERELAAGRCEQAEHAFAAQATERPTSTAAAVGCAAAQSADRKFIDAEKTLSRILAAQGGHADPELVELHQRVTVHSHGGRTPITPPPSAPSHTPREGDRLGEWRLERFLARGGLGQVYLAVRGEERGALKILHPELSQRPGFEDLFKKEMRALSRLDPHPHLVSILDSDRDPAFGCLYFVMPYIEGVTLEHHLVEKGALTDEAARRVFAGLADGLARAHERGVQHRDIKPANIIVQADGTAVLIDWGLSGLTGVAGHTQTAGYTALFAAPETFRTGRPDPNGKSDLYCLAASLFFAVLHGDAARRSTFKADLAPEGLRGMLRQALDNDPSERPTAREFLEALRDPAAEQRKAARVREGETLLARRYGEMLDATQGKPTAEDRAALGKLCREYGVAADRANAIAREERRRWDAAHPPRKERQAGDVEKVALGGVEMRFAWCPPGTFLMGSPPTEAGRSDDETQHRVTLTKGFFMGVTPVTQAQWQAVMGSNPSNFKGNDRPVENVSWLDCQQFCIALGKKVDKRCRLPTEAEWEYACRAGTLTAYHTGDGIADLMRAGWCSYDGTWGSAKETRPVAQFEKNAWNLYDMHGNVWEWCADWFGSYLKEDIKDPQGANNGDARVLRGGSWDYFPAGCRAAGRFRVAPAFRNHRCGCRVVLCLD